MSDTAFYIVLGVFIIFFCFAGFVLWCVVIGGVRERRKREDFIREMQLKAIMDKYDKP